MNKVFFGDCRESMREMIAQGIKAQMCVTSPPYFGLRDYGHPGQLGLEATPAEFVANMVEVFRLVRDVLADDGVLWLNLGDRYAAQRGGSHQPAETLAGGKGGKTEDGLTVNRDRHAGYNPTRNASAIGLKHKDLIGIPWRVAFALQADGWYLRQDIIWHKPNPMPESVTDRCTKAHEYIFMLSKAERYYYDNDAIKEPAIYAGLTGQDESGYKDAQQFAGKHAKTDKQRGHSRRHAGFNDRWDAMDKAQQCSGVRNKRSVWTVATTPYSGAHFATFPPALIEPCIMAGSKPGDIVLDPFFGSGTTGQVSQALGRQWIGCELNPAYESLQLERTAQGGLLLEGAA
jgi:DNA modification methylase